MAKTHPEAHTGGRLRIIDVERSGTNCHVHEHGGSPIQPIAVDGIFGPATKQAVKNVQNKAGITADGIYGPNTARAMKWLAVTSSGATSCRSFSTLGL